MRVLGFNAIVKNTADSFSGRPVKCQKTKKMEETEEIEKNETEKCMRNAVFICERCGRLCIASEILWKSSIQAPNSKQRRLTFSTKTPRVISITLDKSIPWKYSAPFEKSKEKIKKTHFFPVCNKCCSFQIETISRQKEYLKFESINLSRQLTTVKPQIVEDVRNIVVKTQNQVNLLKEVSLLGFSEQQTNISTTKTYLKSQDKCVIISPPKTCGTTHAFMSTMERINVASMMCGVTFSISFYQHYGVINNIRLGFPEHNCISAMEVNAGLIHVCQMLKYLAKKIELDVDNIIISTKIIIKVTNEVKGKETEKELSLDAKDMTTKKGLKLFNETFEHLMHLFTLLFSYFDRGQPKSPFIINEKNKTIGGISYEADSKHPEYWILAMKYLLTDLKTVQLQALRKALINLQ